MAITYVDHTTSSAQATGGAQAGQYNIPFPYLESKHVVVSVGGNQYTVLSNPTFFTISGNNVVLNTPVSQGTLVRITRRSTGVNNDLYPQGTEFVDFQDGSVLTAEQLDNAYQHNLFACQESKEGNITIGTPTLSTDLVTKGYVDGKTDNIDDLGNVNITSLSNSDILRYNSSTSKWENESLSSSPTSSTDVATKGYVDSVTQRYVYDSGWVNQLWDGVGQNYSIYSNKLYTTTLSTTIASYFPFKIHVWHKFTSGTDASSGESLAEIVRPIGINAGGRDDSNTNTVGVFINYKESTRVLRLWTGDFSTVVEHSSNSPLGGMYSWASSGGLTNGNGNGYIRVLIS
jgi:hypothetical protein|tara:strand:+ start:11157 stop:12191 length:1035 start_codon:yes stop_codon:yes gene_type:complete